MAKAVFVVQEEDKPIFFSMGSMPSADPAAVFAIAVGAAKELNKRLLFATGWSCYETLRKEAEGMEDRVLVINKAPFMSVFPRCCCIVHHAGAGTTGTVAASGVPSYVLLFTIGGTH